MADSNSAISPPEDLRRVGAYLDRWKKELLDLTRRNKLLYFHAARGIRIRITGPSPDRLYQRLVLDEKSFTFPSPLEESIDDAEVDEAAGGNGEPRIRPGDLDIELDPQRVRDIRDLQKRLYRLKTDARTTLEEQGINTLYVALGILEWREAQHADEIVKSPLILAPVTLTREKDRPYELGPFEDDVAINPTLKFKLEQDFGLELPPLEPYDGFGEDPDIPGYFAAVAAQVADKGWRVASDAWLAHFSFQKLVMYQDLSLPGTDLEAAMHSVVGAICEVSTPLTSDAPNAEDLEVAFDPPELFPVVDADSSQMEVLARVRAGQSLVVQGPPGTGKSQTIVNLIAQSVREGKSVLFVSEKRAALDVVSSRLDKAGIGGVCLEMHSHKAKKRQVVNELYETLRLKPGPADGDIEKFEQRRSAKEKLRKYVEELHKVRDGRGRSAFVVHGQVARLAEAPALSVQLPIESVRHLTFDREEELTRAVRDLAASGVWDQAELHPWRDADPGDVFVETIAEVRIATQNLRASLTDLNAPLAVAGNRFQLPTDGLSIADLAVHRDVLSLLSSIPGMLVNGWLNEQIPVLDGYASAVEEARSQQTRMRQGLEKLQLLGALSLLSNHLTAREFLDRYRTAYQGWSRVINSAYRNDRKRIQEICGRKFSFADALEALTLCSDIAELKEWFTSSNNIHETLAAGHYRADDTDFAAIGQALTWVRDLRSRLPEGLVHEAISKSVMEDSAATEREAANLTTDLITSVSRVKEDLTRLEGFFPHGLGGLEFDEVAIEELTSRANGWADHVEDLDAWTNYKRYELHCTRLGLEHFLKSCREHRVKAHELEAAFRRRLLAMWLTETYRESPSLGEFSATNHEQLVREFSSLDKQLERAAARATLAMAATRLPDPPPITELGLLRKEYNKKRKHMPLRRLLPGVPTLLTSVKPCLLMSPLSVASYLPRGSFSFDLVIFDEASQVTPADAIGSILRGRQLVVMGDDKQLPPTNFFKAALEDTDEEEEFLGEFGGFESILDVCAGYLPDSSLLWHYRSRDERLVAFSNRRFYGRRLITFPAPTFQEEETGPRFIYLADGVYGRGGSKTNQVEARKVVDLIFEHFESYPERSLGVVALSLAQRDAIDLELRRRRRERPDLDPFFAEDKEEPFFVKNLEAVQGDERDEIQISVGYGPTEPGGTPSLNFGPVNLPGGERRLNVAVTRARYRTTLVSSIRPEQLDGVYQSRWDGPKVLAEYVRYASRGGRFEAEGSDERKAPESDFEEAVLESLIARGYAVDTQIGSSGFQIDLAVRHPDVPTRYILGIECDGAAYHSAKTVRDRDRIRQQVLEDLGWTIHRVWSTDWVRHPTKSLDAISERIDKLRKTGEIGVRRIGEHPEKGKGKDALNQAQNSPPANTLSRIPSWEDEDIEFVVELPSYESYVPSRAPRTPLLETRIKTIADQISELVQVEGPVHVDVAMSRLVRIYGLQKVGPRLRAHLLRSIEVAHRDGGIVRREDFLWTPSEESPVPRGAAPRGVRPAAYVAIEEFEEAAVQVLAVLGATRRDELRTKIARAMGYSRTGPDVATRIDQGIERAIKGARIVDSEGYLLINEA